MREARFYRRHVPFPVVNANGRGPKSSSTRIRRYPSLRAGNGPLTPGDVYPGALAVSSPFDAYMGLACGYAESYRNPG